MSTRVLFATMIVATLLGACEKNDGEYNASSCDCKIAYDSAITYSKGDVVNYNTKCYRAVIQGRGITPSAWMENGNDVWKLLCEQNQENSSNR